MMKRLGNERKTSALRRWCQLKKVQKFNETLIKGKINLKNIIKILLKTSCSYSYDSSKV